MDVVQQLGHLGGAAKRSQLGRTPPERLAVVQGLATGSLRDLGGGWVAAADAEPAVVAARRFGGTVTCVSAAPFYGLRTLAVPQRPHVAVRRDRGPRQSKVPVRLRRESRWTSPPPQGTPVAPLAEVIGRVLRCLPAQDAVVITDSALNQRLVTAEAVARMLTGPGSPAALATLDRCDARSRSSIETLARLALQDAGLEVAAGVVIPDVGEVDLLVEGYLVVECDGFAYHSGRHEYRKDRWRDRTLLAKGYLVLRFTWEEIMSDPQLVVAAVLRVLTRA